MKENQKTNLRILALQQFKEQLEAQNLLPGQFISQRELAKTLELPLGAIREAIPMLEAHGLITTIPQRGLQIFKPDINFIHNAFQLRLFLEQEALSAFMDNPNLSYIEQIKEKLESLFYCTEEEMTNDEKIAEAQAIDFGFHTALIEHLNNDIIDEIYHLNMLKIRLSEPQKTAINSEILNNVIKEHSYILSLILEQKKEEALQYLKQHILAAKNRALGL